MNHLRKKHISLLGAFSQQDSGVWKGDLNEHSVWTRQNMRLLLSGLFSTINNYTFYCLEIPRGATTLTVQSTYQLRPTTGNAAEGYANELQAPFYNTSSGSLGTSYTYNLAQGYKYIGMTFFSTGTKTFEFSKNSGGY